MTSTETDLIDWCRAQDALWLDDNPRAEAIEHPIVAEPRPEVPLRVEGR